MFISNNFISLSFHNSALMRFFYIQTNPKLVGKNISVLVGVVSVCSIRIATPKLVQTSHYFYSSQPDKTMCFPIGKGHFPLMLVSVLSRRRLTWVREQPSSVPHCVKSISSHTKDPTCPGWLPVRFEGAGWQQDRAQKATSPPRAMGWPKGSTRTAASSQTNFCKNPRAHALALQSCRRSGGYNSLFPNIIPRTYFKLVQDNEDSSKVGWDRIF